MENTGMIMKRPSMRSAKIAASDTVARNSGALKRVDVTDGLDIGTRKCGNASGRARGRGTQARPPCGCPERHYMRRAAKASGPASTQRQGSTQKSSDCRPSAAEMDL